MRTTFVGFPILKDCDELTHAVIAICTIDVNGTEIEVTEFSGGDVGFYNWSTGYEGYAWANRILHAPWTWLRSREYMLKREALKAANSKTKYEKVTE